MPNSFSVALEGHFAHAISRPFRAEPLYWMFPRVEPSAKFFSPSGARSGLRAGFKIYQSRPAVFTLTSPKSSGMFRRSRSGPRCQSLHRPQNPEGFSRDYAAICERCRLAGSSCKLAPPAEHRWGVFSPGNDLVSQFPINHMALEIFAGPHDPALHMPGRSLVAVSWR